MKTDNGIIVRRSFAGLLTTGAFLVFFGLVVEPTLPHFMLDRVLLPVELADDAKREATLALLKNANGNRALIWTAAGTIVIVFSCIGWRATQRCSQSI